MRRPPEMSACLLSLATLLACGSNKDENKTARGPEPPPAAAIDAAPAGPTEPPITQAEWDRLLALPAAARLVSPLAAQGSGDRMQGAYCFEKMNAKKVGDALRKALEERGWGAVAVNTAAPDRGSVTAEQLPYRFAATLRVAELQDCSGKAGHAFVSILIQRVGPPPGQPPAPAPPGG
jgi:hypothetical protein